MCSPPSSLAGFRWWWRQTCSCSYIWFSGFVGPLLTCSYRSPFADADNNVSSCDHQLQSREVVPPTDHDLNDIITNLQKGGCKINDDSTCRRFSSEILHNMHILKSRLTPQGASLAACMSGPPVSELCDGNQLSVFVWVWVWELGGYWAKLTPRLCYAWLPGRRLLFSAWKVHQFTVLPNTQ